MISSSASNRPDGSLFGKGHTASAQLWANGKIAGGASSVTDLAMTRSAGKKRRCWMVSPKPRVQRTRTFRPTNGSPRQTLR